MLKVFRAKSVILATGAATRLYPSTTPGWMFNIPFCPACTGSGRAIAYRAGAKLVNMEIPNRHAGPKFLARCGKATWIGLYKDPHGRTVGPFVTRPTRELGDITADVWNSVFTDMFKSGKGPVYIDCTETAKEDIEYMMWGLVQEGNTAMLDYMKKEGIDVRKHRVEFRQYEPFLIGSRGIEIDREGRDERAGPLCRRGRRRQFPGRPLRGRHLRVDCREERRGQGQEVQGVPKGREGGCRGGEGLPVFRFHGRRTGPAGRRRTWPCSRSCRTMPGWRCDRRPC